LFKVHLMWKILVIISVVLIVGGLLLVRFPNQSAKLLINPFIKSSNNQDIKKDTEELVKQTGDSLIDKSGQTLGTFKDNLYQKTQAVVNNVFDKQPQKQEKIAVVLDVQNADPKNERLILDVTQASTLKLNVNKNTKYYLEFKNLPSDQCLFIDNKKYEFGAGKIKEIQFNSSGKYPIKTSSCNVEDKEIGEFLVQ